jgi:predicted membrane metal-binding protein
MLARQAHHLAAPSLAALALIAIDPDHARSPGFQLSLVAVLGILTLGRDLIHLRRRYLPLAPWPLDRPSWRGVLALGRWTGDGLAVGIGASLAVTPVVAWHFGEANPWSPLASLIAGPPLTLVLGAGLPLLLLEGLWPGGPRNGLYVLVDAGLAGLLAVVHWAAATLPGGLVRVAMPSALALLAWPALFLPLRRRSGLLWRGLLLFVLLLLW